MLRRSLSTLILNKPFGVLSRFTPDGSAHECLAKYVPVANVYAAGRLDAESEGLLLLTDDAPLQARLTQPRAGEPDVRRWYWSQVEGDIDEEALGRLRAGVALAGSDGAATLPCEAQRLEAAPPLPPREPPVRQRKRIPTSWVRLGLTEGRNRQVRRMTAAVGFPTLRLMRAALELPDGGPPLSTEGLAPGQWRAVTPEEACRLEALKGAPRMRRAGRGRGGRGRGRSRHGRQRQSSPSPSSSSSRSSSRSSSSSSSSNNNSSSAYRL
jgi:23S rRNA pseudouridine2457 synthase